MLQVSIQRTLRQDALESERSSQRGGKKHTGSIQSNQKQEDTLRKIFELDDGAKQGLLELLEKKEKETR